MFRMGRGLRLFPPLSRRRTSMRDTDDIRTQIEHLIQEVDQKTAEDGKEREVIIAVVNERDVRPEEPVEDGGADKLDATFPPFHRRRWFLNALVILVVLGLFSMVAVQVAPLLLPTTMITLTPSSQHVAVTAEIKAT